MAFDESDDESWNDEAEDEGSSAFDCDEEGFSSESVDTSLGRESLENPTPSYGSSRPLFEAALFPLRVRATRVGEGGYLEVVEATLYSPADVARQRSFGFEFEPVTA